MPIFSKECTQCHTKFESRKDKKYCSRECYFHSKQKLPEEKACEWCEKQFFVTYGARAAQYCSKACSNSGTKRSRVTNECKQCSKTFEVVTSLKGAQFCSLDCKHTNMRNGEPKMITLTCEGCQKKFEKLYIHRKTRHCCSSCAQTGERNPMFGKTGELSSMFGKLSWNNGLTTKTDDRVANLGKKISVIIKKQFENGERSNIGENNPNYGKTVVDRTPAQLDNYSRAAVLRVTDGKSCNHRYANYARGRFTSNKTGETMTYRSSWELRVMKCLDADETVRHYVFESVVLRYGEHSEKRYILDFDVYTHTGERTLIEVKPMQLTEDKKVAAKAVAAEAYAEKMGAEFRFCTLQDIKEWETRLEL
jgi:hypothetical protein